MCLEAIWGLNIQTLSCVGYDHNWVKQYVYADDAAPLLPKGTILHLIGFLDTTAANKNPADERNWAGGGRRSIANMFIDLGQGVALSDEQFQQEMTKRRQQSKEEVIIGCPLCNGRARAECLSSSSGPTVRETSLSASRPRHFTSRASAIRCSPSSKRARLFGA